MSRASADESTISVLVVRGLVAGLEQAGFASQRLLRAGNFDPARLSVPNARVTRAEVFRLCELALDLTADPALGLHWSERLARATFAPVSYLISSSANLRQALRTLEQYYELLSDGDDYEFREEGDEVTLRATLCLPSARVQRFAAEVMVSGFFRLIRGFKLRQAPHWVGFAHPAPSYAAEYVRVFGGAVHFDQPFSGFSFDRSLLDAPSPLHDSDALETLQALADRRLTQLPVGTKYAGRVREILIQEGGPNCVDMASVARTLGLSARSLRRHLTAEGVSYNELARDTAVYTARSLLLDQRLSIKETAHRMGFSEIGSFYRAFKRWTGTTPQKLRES